MDLTAKASIPTHPAASEQSRGISARWGLYLLAFTAAYLLVFCQAIPTFIDEAYSFNLATDKSLTHMLAALGAGADGSFPLYGLMVWGWEKVFGASQLSLRLNNGIFVILFVWQASRRLARHFGGGAAALAILFVLADETFCYFSLQARFYGLVIFLFSVCFWSTWDLVQGQRVSARQQVLHGLFCGLLCLSHAFGLVYTGILGLLYLVFSVSLKKFSFANAVSFLGGPSLFVIWLPSFLQQRLVNPGYVAGAPGCLKYWQFSFFYSKLLFISASGGLTFLAVALSLSRSKRRRTEPDGGSSLGTQTILPTGNALLLVYAVGFIAAMNGVVALLDAIHVIPLYWMKGVRYLLVCWVAYSVVVAAIVAGVADFVQHRSTTAWSRVVTGVGLFVVVACLLALIGYRYHGWAVTKAQQESYLTDISRIGKEQRLTVVCDDYWDAFFLATRTPAQHVFYLLEEGYPFAPFLLQAAKYYPNTLPIYPYKTNVAISAQLHSTNAYLFVRGSFKGIYIVNPQNQRDNK
jgi:hypothetical protein